MNTKQFQNNLENFLLSYEKKKAFELFEQFIEENDKNCFLNEIMVGVMESIGHKWENGDVALSQVYLSSKICEEIVNSSFSGHLEARKDLPKMAIVTLEDQHSLGKRIVYSTLRSCGFDLMDLGQGLSSDEIVKKVIFEGIQILLISVLMYPSALKIANVCRELDKRNVNVKILVGGAPFNIDENLWKTVGAHGMGVNASDDIHVIENWIKEEHSI